ncbi:NAD-dependent succinate-semialdehyde dehydrogenase [Nocardia sp. CWNU-33]|uniref:NAD-dependent succinate-semialdehyde dehydrogenase n=1 Tax=Nocardia sp. CWNU-33 TaxID=3392117 RepID=UPI00398E54CC
MKLFTDVFINGAWQSGTDRVPVHDPSDGHVIAEVATSGPNECSAAIDSAYRAQELWGNTPPRHRAEILRTAYELMINEADFFAELISRENGKAIADARAEVAYAAEFFRWFAEEAVRVRGDYRLAPAGDKRIIVTHEPIGVSLLITPWNFPAAMVTRKLGPALAAGCTVIVKPALETPLTALAIADLLQRAGVPDGVLNVVLPDPVGPLVAEMLRDPRVRNLSFTGSTEVGRSLLHNTADRVVRATMELGGNAPFLVLDDAHIEDAVAGAMLAKMRNGGCACTAANRFYVAREVAEHFTERFAAEMNNLTVGPGSSWETQLGPLINGSEQAKIAGLVARAVKEGARLVTGGVIEDGSGWFYPATVLADVNPEASILSSEIFGPVAPIVVIESDAQATELANATESGLVAYVYSGDVRRAMAVAANLEVGMVAINRGIVSDPAAPFGGVKQSGLGREGGFDGIYEFLETKYIAVDL